MMEGLLRLRSAKSRTTHPILDQKSSFSSRYSSHLKTPDFEHSSSKKEQFKDVESFSSCPELGYEVVSGGVVGGANSELLII